jgi:hypothetical protein
MDTNIYHQMMSLSEMGSNLIGPIDFDDQMLNEINQKLLNSEKDSNVEEYENPIDNESKKEESPFKSVHNEVFKHEFS